MGDQDELCNTRLGLALGFGDYVPKKMQKANKQPKFLSDLSFSLIPRQESAINMQLQANEPSKDSSFGISRDRSSTDYNCNAISGGLERERKKLRLSQEQLTLLEETFKLHTTLNLVTLYHYFHNPFHPFSFFSFFSNTHQIFLQKI